MDKATNDTRQTDSGALRLFLVDDKTGNPVVGVIVSIFAGFPGDGADAKKQDRLLAKVQTNLDGYAKFPFDGSISTTNSRLTVVPGGERGEALALDIAELLAGNDVHTIRVDAAALVTDTPNPGLPSVLSPDVQDLLLSPGSIGLIPQLSHPRGLCSQLMPTTLSVRRFRAFQVLANICNPEVLACPDQVQIVKGKMLEYEIAWHPAGTSLGDLLNTITLAPCEQVSVAIVDWMRRETASRTEATDVQQQSFEQTDDNRLIVETMQRSVKNRSFSLAAAQSSKVGASIPLKDWKLDITSAFGAGAGFSTSSQTVAANTTNNLSERITQAASFVASQRSSVVFQTTASERQTYQTREIANPNPCTALTMMYFQVNRSYRVVTDYQGERDVILVKYENKDIDPQLAYCKSGLLKDALLDPSLSSCFDELAKALYCCDQKPAPKVWLMDSLTLTFKVEGGEVPLQMTLILNTTNGPMTLPAIQILGAVQAGGTFTQTVSLPGQVDPTKVTSILAIFHYLGGLGLHTVFLSNIQVTYHAVGYNTLLALYSSPAPIGVGTALEMSTKAELPPATDSVNVCLENSCCVKRLMAHLNCDSNKRHYNNLIWLNEDPNERVMRWSCCSKGGAPFSLIDQIENTPVTVYGDFVVFPVAGSQLVDDPSILPVSKLVMMPTPGVYAEGILGQCNACEKVDPNRPWNWKKPPCRCHQAPDVTNPSTPRTGVTAGDLKPDEIKNQITFTGVPSAPDSIFGELIKSLISSADSGSSEAKDLLGKVLDLLKGSLTPATSTPEGGK